MGTYHPVANFALTTQAGQRTDPLTSEPATHCGDDWAALAGTEIPAATWRVAA